MKFLFLLISKFGLNFKGIILYASINAIFEVVSISLLLPLIIIIGFDLSASSVFLTNIIENDYFAKSDFLYLILFLVVIKLLFSVYFAKFKSKEIYKTSSNLSQYLFEILVMNPQEYESHFSKGRAGKVCVVECHNVAQSFLNPIITLITDFFVVSILLVYFLYYDLQLTLFAMILILLMGLVFKIIVGDKISIASKDRASSDELRFKLLESFSNLSYFFNTTDKRNWSYEKYKKCNELSRDSSIKYFFWSNFIKSYIEIIIFSMFFILSFINIYIYKFELTNDFIIILGFAAVRLLPSINRILSSYNSIQYSSEPIKIVNNLYNSLQPKVVTDLNESNEMPFVSLNGYKFNRSDKNSFLNKKYTTGLHFFEGQSGSGKTTLFKNIFNSYSESILHGYIVRNCSVFYVSQENHIINGTIDENIFFSNQLLDDKKYCNILDINSFMKDREIIDFGSSFSGGEKQRINILRGLYSDDKILILDEPFASLNKEYALSILEIINEIKEYKCIFISSHTLKNEILSFSDTQTKLY